MLALMLARGIALHTPESLGRMAGMYQGGASGLVTGTVFKTVERQALSLAGSIPVRLRFVGHTVSGHE